MSTVTIVKTLPHLIPIHVHREQVRVYAEHYSPELVRYLQQLKTLSFDHIKYYQLKALLENSLELAQGVIEPGTYKFKGDVCEFWAPGYEYPIRVDLFGDDIEQAATFDLGTGRKVHQIYHAYLSDYSQLELTDKKALHIKGNGIEQPQAVIFSPFLPDRMPSDLDIEIHKYDYTYPSLFWNRMDLFEIEFNRLVQLGYTVEIYTRHVTLLPHELHEYISNKQELANLPAGYISQVEKYALFTDREIFGTIYLTQANIDGAESGTTQRLLRQLEGEISIGDFIVHEDHGVAVYAGLTQEEIDGVALDYLKLEYAQGDELLVPISQINKLTKYLGNEGVSPKLTSLGRVSWEQVKTKVKKSIKILARELIEHYARREMANANAIPGEDSQEFQEFVKLFTYQETPDQIRAINEVLKDLENETPMNRLLVGDVGFGKTEVMLRAAFKIAETGKQVVVLCPTTVLAAQHSAVFTERFKHTRFKVASVSRFNTSKENTELAEQLNSGKIDIVVGTHRLLSTDIKFHDLGLLIVDEEQRFGVTQKEKIKKLNYGVHYLSASATPIPRTLSMALSQVQDISIIATPPEGRKPIVTKVAKLDWDTVVKAVQHEIDRGGQIYFVHNRVQSLASVTSQLHKLLPGIKIISAHGQMPSNQLNKIISDFYSGKYQVLVCTTIIENGLDMPNVNTMIIDQGQKFGLSQLHQLRGRVGRSERQAYCYVFYQNEKGTIDAEDTKIKPEYAERLEALVNSSELGAGFQIASKDLEIRGAGNLLGEQQHGHISSIGYGLYMRLLSQEIERLRELKNNSQPNILSF